MQLNLIYFLETYLFETYFFEASFFFQSIIFWKFSKESTKMNESDHMFLERFWKFPYFKCFLKPFSSPLVHSNTQLWKIIKSSVYSHSNLRNFSKTADVLIGVKSDVLLNVNVAGNLPNHNKAHALDPENVVIANTDLHGSKNSDGLDINDQISECALGSILN